MKHHQDSRIFFFMLFAGVLLLSYLVIQPLISLIILALLIAVLFNPVFHTLKRFLRKTSLATLTTLIMIFASVIIPVSIVVIISINQVETFLQDIGDFAGVEISFEDEELMVDTDVEKESRTAIRDGSQAQIGEEAMRDTKNTIGSFNVQEFIDDINGMLTDLPFVDEGITIDQVRDGLGDIATAAAEFIGNRALNVLASTPVFFTNFIVFIILLVALIPSLSKLKDFALRLSPLDNDIDQLYLRKIQAMATSMVRGTFIIAVAQGLTCGLLLFFAGVDYVVFWTLLCVILSFIPNGAALVNWPILIVLAVTGNIVGALIVLLGNLFIVGSIDNILRPMLVSKDASLHPALTLIGVVGGLQAFGILGFIYGPVILIFLVTTFDIYIHHYRNIAQ